VIAQPSSEVWVPFEGDSGRIWTPEKQRASSRAHRRRVARKRRGIRASGSWGPESVAGLRWWDPEDGVDLGDAGWTWPEGSGDTAYNQVETTLANQPSEITNNGYTQYRFDSSGTCRSSALQWGNTGSFVMGGWMRFPDGAPTGTGIMLQHSAGAGDRGPRLVWTNTGLLDFYVSDDGTNQQRHRPASTLMTDSLWHFLIAEFDESNPTATERQSIFYDQVDLAATFTASPDPILFDPNTNQYMMSVTPDNVDLGVMWLFPGSLAELGAANLAGMHAYKAPLL